MTCCNFDFCIQLSWTAFICDSEFKQLLHLLHVLWVLCTTNSGRYSLQCIFNYESFYTQSTVAIWIVETISTVEVVVSTLCR